MKRAVWQFIASGFAVGGTLSLLCMEPALARAETFLPAQEASQIVAVSNSTVRDGLVSGEIINRSATPVRDVQLLIRQIWYWNNEFQPGSDNPGTAQYYTVADVIPPGRNVPFTYRLTSPAPSRTDGQFEIAVSVAGFTQIYQPGEEPTPCFRSAEILL
jgi:hypothetical protein